MSLKIRLLMGVCLKCFLGTIDMEMLLCVNAHVLHCFGRSSTWIL